MSNRWRRQHTTEVPRSQAGRNRSIALVIVGWIALPALASVVIAWRRN